MSGTSMKSSRPKALPDAFSSPPANSHHKLYQNRSSFSARTAAGSSGIQGKKAELQSADPDEIFTKYTISEVKGILHRLRSDVDAKQEELRLMVGERYRDLLQASDSIIAMSEASTRVVKIVAQMRRTVTADYATSSREGKRRIVEDTYLQALQCLAAHLKLLLDSSEHLWRLLERKQYFQAAWLFLLSRVVYRSLTSEDTEEAQSWNHHGLNVKEQFPLAQRQWETVSQFRTQISHKATLSLREQDISSQDICGTLLALHLLDSLPLSDALDVFLKQRARSLQILYETIQISWSDLLAKSPKNAVGDNKRNPKRAWDVLRSVLDAIAGTVESVCDVYREDRGNGTSLIGSALAFTQLGAEAAPVVPLPTELQLSTHFLISTLPNANNLLALPPDIKSYRPYIDLKSPSSTISQELLHAKLKGWFERAIVRLREATGQWLTHLGTAKDVWDVRALANEWLNSRQPLTGSEVCDAMRGLIDDVCKRRIEQIWKEALREISAKFGENLRSSLSDLATRKEGTELDISPAKFLLSAPSNPSVSSAGLGAPLGHTAFQRFKTAITQRLDGLTPLLENIVSEIESASTRLHNDLNCVFVDAGSQRQLQKVYSNDSAETINRLLLTAESLLGEEQCLSDESLRRVLFIGRVVQKLSVSTIASDLRCSPDVRDVCVARLQHLYGISVRKWSAETALAVKDKLLDRAGEEFLTHPDSVAPSPYLLGALHLMIDDLRGWGNFKEFDQRSSVVNVLLEHLVNAIHHSLQACDIVPSVQFIWDLSFLGRICEEWGNRMFASVEMLEKTIEGYRKFLPGAAPRRLSTPGALQSSVTQYLSRLRLVLAPLIPTPTSPSNAKSPTSPILEFSQQKVNGIAQPQSTVDFELQPVLDLVKPAPRFGSLWVGAANTQ